MLHSHNGSIGDQLAGDGEFVVGQGVDEGFSGSHGLGPGESDHHAVARSGKGHAGSVALGMADQFAFTSAQFEQGGEKRHPGGAALVKTVSILL